MRGRGLSARGEWRFGVCGALAIAFAIVSSVLAAAPAAAVDVRYREVPVSGWSTNGKVYAVALIGDIVYVGGSFSKAASADGEIERDRRNLAAFDRITGELLDFRADTNGVVRGIDGNATTVWIGGAFTTVAGQARQRAAAVDATSGSLRTQFAPDVDGHVWHVEYVNQRVYLGGEFRDVGGVEQRRVASLHPVTGAADPNFRARASGTVRSLAYSAALDILYVGGSFTSIGGTSRDRLAGVDPATGAAQGVDFDDPGALVLDVDVHEDGSMVYAALGGKKNRAQAWSTASGNMRWHRTAMGDVQAISYEDDRVYFGFHEGFSGSTGVKLLAADATSGSMDNGFRPSVNSFYGIWDIDAAPGALIAGGEFTRVEGVRTKGSAIFPRDGIPDVEPPSRVTGVRAVAATASTIELAWDPATDDVGIGGYVVRRDGEVVATAPSAVYLDSGLEPQTAYHYTVEALDSVNRSGGESEPAVLETWAAVIPGGALWAYWDQGPAPIGWKQAAFDDSAWPRGQAQLGFGDDDESTTVERGEPTHYFRHEFVTPGGREVVAASLELVRDDGAVVYLNGTEVMRSNMPGGNIGHDTLAAATTSGSDEDAWFRVDLNASAFRPGTNVIAVEVHQRAPNSSDLSFDLRLDAELSTEPPDTQAPSRPENLRVVGTSSTQVHLAWAQATDDRGIDGYVIKRNGSEVGYSHSAEFTDTNLQPGTDYRYRVVAVDTSLNRGAPSQVLQVETEPDTRRPTRAKNVRLVEATGTSLLVRWNKATDNVGIDHYVVKLDGVAIATTTARTYRILGLEPETEYHVSVRAVDTAGNKGYKSHLYVATTEYIVRRTAIQPGSVWRYLDDGSDQGIAWKRPGHDANAWPKGPAELGYGDGDEATQVRSGPNGDRHITTYFRRKFFVPEADAVTEILLRIVRDDGVVVYVNGQELVRDNMPDGTIDSETEAVRGVAGSEEAEWLEILLPATLLRSGTNSIAVEIHQTGERSSDISFDLELVLNPGAPSPN